MDKVFDFYNYMEQIATKNRFAKEREFYPCTASGINFLEGMLQKFRTQRNFICTSDVCDENTFQQSGGWFKRRSVMVFILMRFALGNEEDRRKKMNECRELFRQIQTRILHDNQGFEGEQLYLNLESLRSSEIGGAFINGCTGLYFMLSADEPTDLRFDPKEWED